MFTLTRVLIRLALLASVVIGLPLTEYEIADTQRVSLPTKTFRLSNSETDRIFGGHEAKIGQFPYQVSLQMKRRNLHYCGGSIIGTRFVLTAGHCFIEKIRMFRVVVGAHELNSSDGKAYELHRFVRHEKYLLNITETNATFINDIGLIKTATDIEFNNLVSPIALHTKFFMNGALAVASGWGYTNDGFMSTNLKFVILNTLTNPDCRAQVRRKINQTAPVHDFGTICAVSGRNGEGICSGDTGGPLVFENRLIGISSWALVCGKGSPAGFTRISSYVKWINMKIKSL